MTKDNKDKIKELIKKYPKYSGNKIYELSKKQGIGIRKQTFYEVFRESKKQSKPTDYKRVVSTPIKYRTPETIKPIVKKGIYGVAEVKDLDKKDVSFWIKYEKPEDFDNQINTLLNTSNDKGSDLSKNYDVVHHAYKKTRSFIAEEYRKKLVQRKIKIT